MLQVMHRHGDEIKPIFTKLIKNNPIDRVFRFLDETASPWDTVMLMASLPPWQFLQALYRLKVLHRI
jgi:lycopene beta-cyclase